MLSFHKRETAAYGELGCSGSDDDLTNYTKQAFAGGLPSAYILLSGGTPAPMWVFS